MTNRLTKRATLAATTLTVALLSVDQVFAQPEAEICRGSGGTWKVDTCVNTNASTPLFGSDSIFANIINVMLFVIGGISVIMLIIGGIRYAVSGGDANAVQGAKNTVMYSIVGVVVAFLAYALVNFVINSL